MQVKQLPLLVVLTFLMLPLSSKAQDVAFDWVAQLGGGSVSDAFCANETAFNSLAIDKSGYIYTAGTFRDLINFNPKGTDHFLNSNKGQQFIAKYDDKGMLIWVKQFGNSGTVIDVKTSAVEVDNDGNVLVGGYFQGRFVLDTGANAPVINTAGLDTDIFMIQLDSSGNMMWWKQFGGSGDERLFSIKTDNSGNIFATGSHTDIVDWDSSANSSSKGGAYLLKLDNNANFEWVNAWGDVATGNDVTVDNNGDVLVVGSFQGNDIDFNPSSGSTFLLSSYGMKDIFISKFDNAGSFIWSKKMGGARDDEGLSIDTDDKAAIYTTGYFSSTAEFNSLQNSYTMTSDASNANLTETFITKMDRNGNFLWAKQLHGIHNDHGYSLAVGKGRGIGVYATGIFKVSSYYFEPGMADTVKFIKESNSGDGSYLLKLDTSGGFQWGKYLQTDFSGNIAVDDFGSVFTSGYYHITQTLDFDPGEDTFKLDRIGRMDGYVHKMRWCNDGNDTLVVEACESFYYNGQTYTQSGSYTVEDPEACASSGSTQLELTITHLEKPVINVDEFTLGVTNQYLYYQWLKDGVPITGANDSIYEVSENGDYQVIVSNNDSCYNKTSDVYTVLNANSIRNLNANDLKVYPNPVRNYIHVQSAMPIELSLVNMEGQILIQSQEASIDMSIYAEGLYLLRITDSEGNLLQVNKIVKVNDKP